jgi:putative oxidoreductase
MATATVPTGYNPMLPLLSRILIGALFLVAGTRKFMFFAGSAGYFAKLGFPAPEVMTWVSITIEILGGLLLIIGWRTRIVAWVLVIFVAVATAMAHRFWEFPEAQFNNQLNHFLKNIAIIGGLLMVTAFGPGTASVDKN